MTLAQAYLEQGQAYETKDPNLNRIVQWTHDFITLRLLAPASSAPGDAERTAERFVFDENPAEVVQHLKASGQIDWETVLQTIYTPHMNMWMEFPVPLRDKNDQHFAGTAGIMLGKIPLGMTVDASLGQEPVSGLQDVAAIVIHSTIHDELVPLTLIQLPSFPVNFTKGDTGALSIRYRPFYFADHLFGNMTEPEFREVDQVLQDIFSCLFVLTLPRAVEYRPANFGPRKAKVRARTGKPFMELKRVHIRIGKAATRYTGGVSPGAAGEGTGKRKLHRVGFFLRTYRKRQGDTPKVVLMEPFWRGDPKLGVIVKEKHYHGEAIKAAAARNLDLSKLRGE